MNKQLENECPDEINVLTKSSSRYMSKTGCLMMSTAILLLSHTEQIKAFNTPSTQSHTFHHHLSNTRLDMSTTTPINKKAAELVKKIVRTSSSPVVVSAEAEALSHSSTTMKLIPSFEIFQILPDDEGGFSPLESSGNSMREKVDIDMEDTLSGLALGDYKGCGGKKKIESLPDPFAMVEKELKPFSDSITELVSSDQPILSMAAKHFFEKGTANDFVQLLCNS